MHPSLPKREEELADHVELWRDKMGRLEAHGDQFELAPLFKINALRKIITGEAKEYFDLWEADRDPTDAAKTYQELLNKVKDYSRRRKLDSSAKDKSSTRRRPHGCGSCRRMGPRELRLRPGRRLLKWIQRQR